MSDGWVLLEGGRGSVDGEVCVRFFVQGWGGGACVLFIIEVVRAWEDGRGNCSCVYLLRGNIFESCLGVLQGIFFDWTVVEEHELLRRCISDIGNWIWYD